MTDLDRLMLGLQQRVKQVEENVIVLEKEDDRNLYGAVSLRIIELEIAEIQDLLDKLNRTTQNYQHLSVQTAAQVTCCTKKVQIHCNGKYFLSKKKVGYLNNIHKQILKIM